MKKKVNFKLKERKTKVAPKKPIENAIFETLEKYIDLDFDKVKENIEIDLKNIFKKYPNLEYLGYSTQLGMLEDLKVHFKEK